MMWKGESLTLDVRSPEGALYISGEPRLGWLALGADLPKPRTFFVEVATGAVVRVEEGLTPASGSPAVLWNDPQALPAGSPGARLFVGTRGELVRIDPETGRREAVLVPPGPEDGE
jgi:hypothetical protein